MLMFLFVLNFSFIEVQLTNKIIRYLKCTSWWYYTHTHTHTHKHIVKDFSGSSAGKDSACNVGNPSSIPGSGRSPGEGIVYPLQYSWASLVAQTVKNPPAMRETWFWSLGWEDSLEEGMATHSSILAWRIPVDRGTWWAIVHGVANSRTQLS